MVYFEPQEAALCGNHCLNNVLQTPYFTEFNLADIAHELDAEERAMMAEQGVETAEFIAFAAQESQNVDGSGNFSIQVLGKALNVFNIVMEPITSPAAADAKANPVAQTGFICNLQAHWFAVRKIGGTWYNLNSLLKAPEEITDFYLALYFETLVEGGYSIFVLQAGQGEWPRPQPGMTDAMGRGTWLPRAGLPKAGSSDAANKAPPAPVPTGGFHTQGHVLGGGAAAGGGGPPLTQDALSRALAGAAVGGAHGGMEEDDDLAAALAMSLNETGGAAQPALPQAQAQADDDMDGMDPELAEAIRLSQQEVQSLAAAPAAVADSQPAAPSAKPEVPEGTPGAYMLQFRLPNGSTLKRRHLPTDPVSDLFVFLTAECGTQSLELTTAFPRFSLSDSADARTLAECSWDQPTSITVKVRAYLLTNVQ